MDSGMDLSDMVCKSHEDDDVGEELEEAEEPDRELYNFSKCPKAGKALLVQNMDLCTWLCEPWPTRMDGELRCVLTLGWWAEKEAGSII